MSVKSFMHDRKHHMYISYILYILPTLNRVAYGGWGGGVLGYPLPPPPPPPPKIVKHRIMIEILVAK